MAQSYVISGTDKRASVDGTERVVLEADKDGNPSKVIGVDEPCELSKGDKEKLNSLGINFEKAEGSSRSAAPQAGTDTAAAGPSITS